MLALARGQASDCSNPVLSATMVVGGVLTDVYALEYVIYDVTSGTPSQVYPPVGAATVDVENLCPVGGKLGTGRYVADYTPDGSEPLGAHQIEWTFQLTATSEAQTFTEDFDVLAAGATSLVAPSGYTSVSALRAEGLTDTTLYPDALLLTKIARAAAFIDRATGRSFAAQTKTVLVDGRGTAALLLLEPIVGIGQIRIVSSETSVPSEIALADVRVYSRHISQGLMHPDDRDNPRVEFAWSAYPDEVPRATNNPFRVAVWPKGYQNVEVTGVFGYTDPNGTPTGGTPLLIQRVSQLLVIRDLAKLADTTGREDLMRRWRILSERTRDQSYTLTSVPYGGKNSALVGTITGDPEIDTLLQTYRRPALMGSA